MDTPAQSPLSDRPRDRYATHGMNPLASHPVTPTECTPSPTAYPFPLNPLSPSVRPSLDQSTTTTTPTTNRDRRSSHRSSSYAYTPPFDKLDKLDNNAYSLSRASHYALASASIDRAVTPTSSPRAAEHYHRSERRSSFFARRLLGPRTKSSSGCLQLSQTTHYVPSGTDDNPIYIAAPPSPATSALMSPSPSSSAYTSSRASVDQALSKSHSARPPKASVSPLRRSFSSPTDTLASTNHANLQRGRASITLSRTLSDLPGPRTSMTRTDDDHDVSPSTPARMSLLRKKSLDWFGLGLGQQARRRKSGTWWGLGGPGDDDADAVQDKAGASFITPAPPRHHSRSGRTSLDATRPRSRLEEAVALDLRNEADASEDAPRGRARGLLHVRLSVLAESGSGGSDAGPSPSPGPSPGLSDGDGDGDATGQTKIARLEARRLSPGQLPL